MTAPQHAFAKLPQKKGSGGLPDWEAKGDNLPTSTTALLRKIETALLVKGVAIFREPSPGARIALTNSDLQELPPSDS